MIPSIALTTTLDAWAAGQGVGMEDYIKKQFKRSALLHLSRSLLRLGLRLGRGASACLCGGAAGPAEELEELEPPAPPAPGDGQPMHALMPICTELEASLTRLKAGYMEREVPDSDVAARLADFERWVRRLKEAAFRAQAFTSCNIAAWYGTLQPRGTELPGLASITLFIMPPLIAFAAFLGHCYKVYKGDGYECAMLFLQYASVGRIVGYCAHLTLCRELKELAGTNFSAFFLAAPCFFAFSFSRASKLAAIGLLQEEYAKKVAIYRAEQRAVQQAAAAAEAAEQEATSRRAAAAAEFKAQMEAALAQQQRVSNDALAVVHRERDEAEAAARAAACRAAVVADSTA